MPQLQVIECGGARDSLQGDALGPTPLLSSVPLWKMRRKGSWQWAKLGYLCCTDRQIYLKYFSFILPKDTSSDNLSLEFATGSSQFSNLISRLGHVGPPDSEGGIEFSSRVCYHLHCSPGPNPPSSALKSVPPPQPAAQLTAGCLPMMSLWC